MKKDELLAINEYNDQKIATYKGKDFIYNVFPVDAGVKPEGAMFIMHGYGGDVNQWNERAIEARRTMPNMAVFSIQAPIKVPHTYEGGRSGYAWANMETPLQQAFSIADHAIGGMKVYKKINEFINFKLEKMKLQPENACLVGCSLGGLIGIPTALKNKEPYGLVVGAITSVLPFSKYNSKPEVYMACVKNDEHFDVPVTPIDADAKGLKKFFNRISHKMSGLLNTDQGVERLKKHGVPVAKDDLYEVHWSKEPLFTIKHEPVLENGKQVNGHLHHRVSDRMWYDALKYTGSKLGLDIKPQIERESPAGFKYIVNI